MRQNSPCFLHAKVLKYHVYETEHIMNVTKGAELWVKKSEQKRLTIYLKQSFV